MFSTSSAWIEGFTIMATNYNTFYAPPNILPTADPGYIIKSERSNLAKLVVTIAAVATRVMYLSTDSRGNPNAVVGTYFEPTADWAGSGDRPLVVMAPGTMGQGDQCAPSRLFNQVIYCGGQKDFMAEYQAGNVASKVDLGMAVFVTDYENIGTSFATGKKNTFANRKAQGYAVIDGARAAFNLPNTTLTSASKITFWGYSQGAGAAGAAAELLAAYAPELTNVVGAYLGSPPSDFFELVQTLDGNMLVGIVAWLINGFKVTYPTNVTAINAALTALGQTWCVNAQRMCVVEIGMTYGFKPIAPLFTACKTVDDVIRLINTEPFYTMLHDQALGAVEPSVPIMIQINAEDPLVSYKSCAILAQKWCALGADVEFVKSLAAIPTLGLQRTNLIHYVTAQTDNQVSLNWMTDRFNGVVTNSNCALIGTSHSIGASLTLNAELTSSAGKE